MYTLKIKITKEVLLKTMYCAANKLGENCAISYAVREIFPYANTNTCDIRPFICHPTNPFYGLAINLPIEARMFIRSFDALLPNDRMMLPELEFEVGIPDGVIDRINIDEIKSLLENHPTLTLINA